MSPRSRRWALLVLGISVALLGLYVVSWLTTPTARALRADFVGAYMGSQIFTAGHGSQLYDLGLQAARYHALTAPNDYPLLAFYSTPSAALLAAPFTVVSELVAWRLFSLLQLAMLIAAAVVAMRAAPWPARTPALLRAAVVAAALAALFTDVLFLQGQWAGFFALGIALGYRALRLGHDSIAAFWLLAPVLAVKPNLGLGLLAFAIGWGGLRALRGAAAAGTLVLVLSVLVGGFGIVPGFLHAALGSRSVWPLASMDGITGITGELVSGPNGDLAGFAACVLLAAAAFPLGRVGRRTRQLEPALAAALALTLLASPHLYLQDLAILTPAAVWTMAWAYGADQAEVAAGMSRMLTVLGGWVALSLVAALQPADFRSVPGRLVPWVLLAAAVALGAVTRPRRQRILPSTPAPPPPPMAPPITRWAA